MKHLLKLEGMKEGEGRIILKLAQEAKKIEERKVPPLGL